MWLLRAVSLVVASSALLAACEPTSTSPTAGTPRDAGSRPHLDGPAALADADALDARDDTGDAGVALPIDVPITLSAPTEGGTVRFTIPVTFAQTQVDVFLDTGSSGVRILPGVLPDSAFEEITETTITARYHSGLLLSGVVATIAVSVGGLSTPSPIPVMLVRSVSCEPSMPACGAENRDAGAYTFFDSARVLLGVGLRNLSSSGVASPLAQLAGTPSFLISGAAYGGTTATLRLRANPAAIAGLKTFVLPVQASGVALPNGVQARDDRYGLPTCLDDSTTGVDYCSTAELDTGNPGAYIEWPGADDAGPYLLQPGNVVKVAVGPDAGLLGQYAFTVGSPPSLGIDAVEVEPATLPPYMNLGAPIFFHYDVYYAPKDGVIGLAAR